MNAWRLFVAAGLFATSCLSAAQDIERLVRTPSHAGWMEIARLAQSKEPGARLKALRALGNLNEGYWHIYSKEFDRTGHDISNLELTSKDPRKAAEQRRKYDQLCRDRQSAQKAGEFLDQQLSRAVGDAIEVALADRSSVVRAAALESSVKIIGGFVGVSGPRSGSDCFDGRFMSHLSGTINGALEKQATRNPSDLLALAAELDINRSPAALEALSRSGVTEAVPVALRWLGSKDADVRFEGVRFFVELQDDKALPRLTQLMGDPNEQVAAEATGALGQYGPCAARYVISQLDRLPGSVAPAALMLIGSIFCDESAREVLRRIDSQTEQTQIELLIDLGYQRNTRPDEYSSYTTHVSPGITAAVARYLRSRLNDPSPKFRRLAAGAIESLGDPASAPALVPLADDRDARVRVAALSALGSLKDPRFIKLFERAVREEETTDQAIEALSALGTVAFLSAERLARDPVAHVRGAALEIAAEIDLPDVAMLLIKGLSDIDAEVRQTAASMLVRNPTSSALNPLLRACGDRFTGVRAAALSALVKLGDVSAIPALLERKRFVSVDERAEIDRAIHNILVARG